MGRRSPIFEDDLENCLMLLCEDHHSEDENLFGLREFKYFASYGAGNTSVLFLGHHL